MSIKVFPINVLFPFFPSELTFIAYLTSSQSNVKQKQNIDQIWEEMKAGSLATKCSRPKPTSQKYDHLSEWLSAEPSKPNFSVLPRLADLEDQAAVHTHKIRERQSAPKTQTGLEDALAIVRGGNNSTVLDNTRQSWQHYKKDQLVREELDTYKKDKGRYTDKVAFLERSDIREWEYEQQGRKSRR